MAISSSSRGLRPGVCTSTTRPENPYDGMIIYETDTDKVAVYDVNAWVYKTGTTAPTAPALVLIASATYSAATSFTISSCFTSTYRNYRLIFDSTTNNPSVSAQLLVGNTPSTTGYHIQRLEAGSTSVAATRSTSQSSMALGPLTDGFQIDVMIYRPQLTVETGFMSFGAFGGSFATDQPTISQNVGCHAVETAYDGITITGAASSLTGRYSIYGLTQ